MYQYNSCFLVKFLSFFLLNFVKFFSADMVQKANSGHPGAPMGLAPAAHIYWTKIMKYNPSNPKWVKNVFSFSSYLLHYKKIK